ncbi:hypothetical protein BG842_03485 [Haladaptatus sp. W1]|nr:hypothetical protein BG842_03485 [Haladaptatus sp. W1]
MAKYFRMVGEHRQFPPTVQNEEATSEGWRSGKQSLTVSTESSWTCHDMFLFDGIVINVFSARENWRRFYSTSYHMPV